MKRFVALVAVLFCAHGLFAQDNASSGSSSTSATYVSSNAKIDKYHTEAELDKMGKLELTEIYLERVSVVSEVLPYLALHRAPSGATLQEMGIPETKNNVSNLEKEVKNKNAYLETVKTTLHDIIPYADKRNIIWCILFLEDVLHQVEKAAKQQD